MTLLGDLLSTVFERRHRQSTADITDERPLEDLTRDLIGAAGEVSGQALARQILGRYETWNDDEKLRFFHHLAEDMNVSAHAVRTALDAFSQEQTQATYRAFMAASEPARQELIRRLNHAPGATRQLVNMRADLLRLGRNNDALQALDLDFRHLFASWFNRGFLVLRPVNWESPAHILEKIIAYEAVHAIGSWEDLRRRVEPEDRRCFAFFHPAMPDEPLIFVEVALTHGIPNSVQNLLAEERAALHATKADTAVFYSISNCQAGLASISFGNSLIKQVASDLSLDLPNLTTFVTLSPIPGLMRWVAENATDLDMQTDEAVQAAAAHYIASAKRSDGAPLDPVARFHLGNGASVHRVHARADISEKGIAQSAGAMVNYLYDLEKISQNHERYATTFQVVTSPEIAALSKIAAERLTQETAR